MIRRFLRVLAVTASFVALATPVQASEPDRSKGPEPWSILGGLISESLTVQQLGGPEAAAMHKQYPPAEFSPFGGAATWDFSAIDVDAVSMLPFPWLESFDGDTMRIPCGAHTVKAFAGGADVPVNVICPEEGEAPGNSVEWWMLAISVSGPLPVTDCGKNKIETGVAINAPALGKPYAAPALAPGDLFHTTNIAQVLRCDNGEWVPLIQSVFNPQTGSFDESPSPAGGVVWPGGVLLFLPINDTAPSATPFTFATDADNPSAPDTVRASRLGGERGVLIPLEGPRTASFPAQIVAKQTTDVPAEPVVVTSETVAADEAENSEPASDEDEAENKPLWDSATGEWVIGGALILLLTGVTIVRRRQRADNQVDITPVAPGEPMSGDGKVTFRVGDHDKPEDWDMSHGDIGHLPEPKETPDPQQPAATKTPPAQTGSTQAAPAQPTPEEPSVLDEIDESGGPPGLS